MTYKFFKAVFFLLVMSAVAFLVAFITSQFMLKECRKNSFDKKVYSGTPKQLKALSNGWNLLYRLPQDTPARFALNEIASRKHWRAFNLLRGDWPGSEEDRVKASETLEKLEKRIDTGLNWPYKNPPAFKINYTKTAPKIDAYLKDNCWNNALTFKGSYHVDLTKEKDDGSIWKMLWDDNYIYIGVHFPDSNILPSKTPGQPYKGDSLEIFLMPSKEMKMYWEVIIGCEGDLFDSLQCNNRYGNWASNPAAEIKGLKFKTLKQKSAYTIEIAIPFLGLPNYMLGNQPKDGETIYFAVLRSNKDNKNGKVVFTSALPLLYGGHNIFGHAKGILKKEENCAFTGNNFHGIKF